MSMTMTLTVLLITEGTLRMRLGPPPPPVNVFQVKGVVDTYLHQSDDMVQTTYQLIEPIAPFPLVAEEPRVVVLGGSSVHIGDGGVPGPLEFPSLLDAMLPAEVLNLGAPGIDSHDIAPLVQELAELDVDVLVLYTGHNDLGNALFQERYGDFIGQRSAAVLPYLERLQIFCQLRRLLTSTDGEASRTTLHDSDRSASRVEQRAVAIRFFSANLAQVVWQCQQTGIALVLVVPASDLLRAPSHAPCEDDAVCPQQLWSRAQRMLGYDPTTAGELLRAARDADAVAVRAPTAMEDAIRELGSEPGVLIVDASALLPREEGVDAPSSSFFRDHIHFSIEGHQAMAELLAEPIRSVLP